MIKFKFKSEKNYRRADLFLSKKIDNFSRTEIKKNIKEGNLFVNNNRVISPSTQIKKNDQVELTIEEKTKNTLIPQNINLNILYQDTSLIAVNKEHGMVVHPGAGNKKDTLVNALLAVYPELEKVGQYNRPGIVHRLDKDTSGIILIAKNKSSYLKLQRQFADRKVKKTYLLIIKGKLNKKNGKFEFPIGRHKYNRKKISQLTDKPRPALTYYKKLYHKKGFSLILAYPKTGRTHQIRVHFSESGFPIIGDPIYGRNVKNIFPRLALHSKEITILHPKNKHYITFYSFPPKIFFEFFKKL